MQCIPAGQLSANCRGAVLAVNASGKPSGRGPRRRRWLSRCTEPAVRPSAMVLVFGVLLAGCGSSPTSPDPVETCEGFGDWQGSPYVLPYAVGASYFVDQGNCSPTGNGHRGVTKFGYDFLMPIGTAIYAARAGLVTQVEESHFDGQVAATGFDNFV